MTRGLPVMLFDYGVGNLHSIRKALEQSGAVVTVTPDAADLLDAAAIVLPGVGAFGTAMQPLLDVREPLRERLRAGTPCLAVCIGMQLLYEDSEESPGVPGIGLLAGHIRRFPSRVGKIPHMGWNSLEATQAAGAAARSAWDDTIPDPGVHVYYVHSYYAEPASPGETLLTTRYGSDEKGIEFPAIVAKGGTLAAQFHPEKSSRPGLRLIDHWVQTSRRRLEKVEKTGQRQNIDTPTEGSPPQKGPGDRP